MSGLAAGIVLDGRYRIEERLGAGGMGAVYRARDLAAGRPVAVKVLLQVLEGEEHRHRFQREFRILTRLAHPRVVAVYDYGQCEGTSYYVMELLGGVDLVAYRQQRGGRLPEAEVRALAAQLCQGLAYIHAEGLIHRDLKPGNVRLLGAGGEAPESLAGGGWSLKLMDFGLARAGDSSAPLTASGAVLGTVNYMAPEQAQGRPLDPRADLYALGVILYELAAGRLPFGGDSPVAVLLAHIQSLPVPPSAFQPDLSPGLVTLIMQLLAKRPADRPATAGEVLAALERDEAEPGRQPATRPALAGLARADVVFYAHLVGRDAELERLSAVLERAWQRRPVLALVEGEAGVGKTRLVRELADQARLRGGKVLSGACYEAERLPYGPFVEALRSLLPGRRDGEEEDLLAGLEDDLLPLFPSLEAATLVSQAPDQARLRLFDAAARLLARLAARQPVLLLLDDLHWADEASLELLGYLVRNGGDRPILICATARRDDAAGQQPLARLAWALVRQHLVERIDLAPLSPRATADLLGALLGRSEPPEALAGAIMHYAEGNPFFVEELVKMLAEEGRLERRADGWRLAGDTTAAGLEVLAPPSTIRALIERRLETLPAAECDAVRRAAVLGREFVFDLLLALGDEPEDDLLDVITGLLRARLIEEIPDPRQDRYRFAHGMIQEVVYAGLPRRLQRRLHRAAGEALERLSSGRQLDVAAGQLAFHFARGGDPGRAIAYGLQAGDRARRLYANQEAVRAYSLALEALLGLPEAERAAYTGQHLALLEGLGDVYLLTGDYEPAAGHLRDRLALLGAQAGAVGPDALAATWQKLAASHRYRGQYAEAVLSLEWALAALGGPEERPAQRASLLLDLGWIAVRQARHGEANDRARQALALADRTGDDAGDDAAANTVRAGAYDCLGMVARYQSDYAQAVGYYRQSLALKEAVDDKGGIARTLNNLGALYLEQDDYAEAQSWFRRSLALCEEIGHRLGQAMSHNNLGLIELSLGHYPPAIEHYQRTLAISGQIGHLSGIVMAHNNLGEAYQAMGAYHEALEHLRQAETLAGELGESERLVNTFSTLAEVYIAMQDMAQAAGYARRALDLAQEAGLGRVEEEARERLARALLAQGDAEAAHEQLQRALELSQTAGHRDLADKIRSTLDRLQATRR